MNELYDLCEAFFGRGELSYEEWLVGVSQLTQGRGIDIEDIEWWKWNKEKNKKENKEDKVIEVED